MKDQDQKTKQLAFDFAGTGEAPTELSQGDRNSTEQNRTEPLAHDLIERMFERSNFERAWRRVRANNGKPGIDGVTVEHFLEYWKEHGQVIQQQLLEGNYQPQPVRRVEIPKPDGGKRQLGIPTVVDRLIQQALHQVLEPIFDPHFSPSSYGFRKGRDCHQALRAAQQHVAEGREWVVDLDLEKFFDRVNHDILMSRLMRRIGDKRVLQLIRRMLRSGAMLGDVYIPGVEGTPQGGPLSPLLANVVLDELDKELEKRGLKFCRYADDCNIYVKSKRAGERVKASITAFIEKKLKLKVNDQKSGVDRTKERKFLGMRIIIWKHQATISIHPKSIIRFKQKVRQLTRRTRRIAWSELMEQLTRASAGWINYFHIAQAGKYFRELDQWICRRLRCFIWTEYGNPKTRYRKLRGKGIPYWTAWPIIHMGNWAAITTPTVRGILSKSYLKRCGYWSLYDHYQAYSS